MIDPHYMYMAMEVVPALQDSIRILGRCLTCGRLRRRRDAEHLLFAGVCHLPYIKDVHASVIYALPEVAETNLCTFSFTAITLSNVFLFTKTNVNVFDYEDSC